MATKVVKYPDLTGTHLLGKWNKSVVLVVTFIGLTMIPPGSVWAEDQASGTDSSEGTGIQVASWALTVPYAIGKGAFAVGGGIVGGLGYLFSGGNSKTAESVWTTSIYGTYILRPANLRGEEPIHFLGKADGSQSEAAPRPVEPTPGTSEPAKK